MRAKVHCGRLEQYETEFKSHPLFSELPERHSQSGSPRIVSMCIAAAPLAAKMVKEPIVVPSGSIPQRGFSAFTAFTPTRSVQP